MSPDRAQRAAALLEQARRYEDDARRLRVSGTPIEPALTDADDRERWAMHMREEALLEALLALLEHPIMRMAGRLGALRWSSRKKEARG